jgi:tRNA-2-methylthio-N6-dimethylallyladenosine synthase
LGYQPTARAADADIIVLNTCVVRQQPEDKAVGRLNQLRAVKRKHPERILALMGCMVGVKDPAPLEERFPWVDLFLPPSDPTALWEALAARGDLSEAQALIADAESRRLALGPVDTLLPASEQGRIVRAYIPIVLGCSHACTYCVIPYRRGAERSRPMEVVMDEARHMVEQGVREITLLGQIVDRYGYDLPSFESQPHPPSPPLHKKRMERGELNQVSPLVMLLRRLHEIEGLWRLRFLTSHPNWMRDDLLQAVAELPKVCEHIEVPIQAGDDEILSRMRRGYTVANYRRLVGRIRDYIPGVSIATDIIVGFPGETKAQFQHTYDLLEDLRLDKVHIARYSPRPLTVATRQFEDDVSYEEKERRRRALDQQQARILGEINAAYQGQEVEVLVEGQKKGRWFGRTRTDRLVYFEVQEPISLLGKLVQVTITWTGPWSLVGKVKAED